MTLDEKIEKFDTLWMSNAWYVNDFSSRDMMFMSAVASELVETMGYPEKMTATLMTNANKVYLMIIQKIEANRA